MTPSGADQVGGPNALPIRLVMLATALALALIASMGWYVWNSVEVLHEVQMRTFRLLSLTTEIAYLNEPIWTSARLRVTTGDERWRERYSSMLARRNAAIDQFRTLAPDLFENPAAIELRGASEKLRGLERQALALAAGGDSAQAIRLLTGSDYNREKQLSADATSQIATDLGVRSDKALDQRRTDREAAP
jgi:hypothetical protein